MSDLTENIRERLPDDFPSKVRNPDYNEETAAKNYGVQVLQLLGLENADFEEWIGEDDRPDFIWNDVNGITRIVGEFKAPWDEDHSPPNPRYKLEEGIQQSLDYNDTLKLKYVLVTDGRWIHLRNVYAEGEPTYELDLLEVYNDHEGPSVETDARELREQLTSIYGGVWNETPSERDISEDRFFEEFIQASKWALNDDLLPSIKSEFERYSDGFDEFETAHSTLEREKEETYEEFRRYREPDIYKEAIDRAYDDPYFDYIEHFEDVPKDVDREACIEQVEEFVERIRGIQSELRSLEHEYRLAINWHEKWEYWLFLRGVDYEDATGKHQQKLKETFQLQTLNLLYNRMLLIRVFEDLGIIGQIISDGFIKTFDEKVKLRRGNRYREPLETASKQAREVYNPLFERDTPHDWYHYEEDILKTVLRRFDNFNFRYIDQDIFGEMYQRCLDEDKRERLGSFYTPPEVINFLLDYTGYTLDEQKLRRPDEKVVDPACGSGTFLLEFFERYIDAERTAGWDLSDEHDLMTIIRNLNRKLRGLDIDPFAVQLAQSNLLIRILQKRRDDREKNDGAITTETEDHLELPEFSVYETDSLLTVKDNESLNRNRFYRAREPDPEHLNEVVEAKEDDYSLVMGNPPYVRYHNQSEITSEYQRLHDTFGDNGPDIYVGFVEQALDWVEDGGQVAFVISDRILVNTPARPIREYILDNATIDLIVDLTRSKIFGFDVDVFPLLVVLTKKSGDDNEAERENNEIDVAKVFVKGSWEHKTWSHALDYVASEVMGYDEPDYDFGDDFSAKKPKYEGVTNEDAYTTYTVSQSRFTEKRSDWSGQQVLNVQITDDLWDVVLHMENADTCVPLREITQLGDDGRVVARGGGSSAISSYEIDSGDPAGTPVMTGGDIDEFLMKYGSERSEYVDYDELKQDFEDDSRTLKMSEDKADVILNEKVIAWRYTASKLSFVVDDPQEHRRFLKRRIYFLLLKESNGFDEYTDRKNLFSHHYVCGVLNSDLLDFYYKAYYEHKAFRHAPEIDAPAEYLEHLPIYIPDDDQRREIATRSKALHDLRQRQHQTVKRRENLFDHYREDGKLVPFRDYIRKVIKEHDTYSFSSLNTEIEGAELQLNQNFVIEAYSEEKAQALEAFLRTFEDVFDEGQFIGGRLDELSLPADLDEFSDEYDRLASKISRLEDDIAEQKAALNEAVYDMYGIDESIREDIREYLDDFLTVIE